MKILKSNDFVNESNECDAFDICREICDCHVIQDDTEGMSYSDTGSFSDEHYPDISDDDKERAYGRTEKFANVTDCVSE